jgi:hypothetical protein
MQDAIIELYEGRLGGGKTYACVKRIFEVLKEGWVVQTNITLNWEEVTKLALSQGYELDRKQYIKLQGDVISQFYDHITAGEKTMLVLDEAHLWFDQHSYKQHGGKIMEVLTQARKLQLHILLITQHRNNLSSQFRRMLQYIWICRDVQKFKILGVSPPIPMFVQVCMTAEQNEKLDTRWFKKDKRFFKLYESKELLKDIKLGFERPDVKVTKIKNEKREKWKRRLTYALLVLASYSASRLGNGGKAEKVQENEPAVEVVSSNNTKSIPTKQQPEQEIYYAGFYILDGLYWIYREDFQTWIPEKVKRIDGAKVIELVDGTKLLPNNRKPIILSSYEKAVSPD